MSSFQAALSFGRGLRMYSQLICSKMGISEGIGQDTTERPLERQAEVKFPRPEKSEVTSSGLQHPLDPPVVPAFILFCCGIRTQMDCLFSFVCSGGM